MFIFNFIHSQTISLEGIIEIVALIFLFLGSAMFSASKTAYFSFKSKHFKFLEESKSKKDQRILYLLKKPEKLLAKITIGNSLHWQALIKPAYLKVIIKPKKP